MRDRKEDRKRNIILILMILLILAIGYILVNLYAGWKQQRDNQLLQTGAQYGYEQAIIQIAQKAVTCEQVPLTIENQTISLIAVDCLKQAG